MENSDIRSSVEDNELDTKVLGLVEDFEIEPSQRRKEGSIEQKY